MRLKEIWLRKENSFIIIRQYYRQVVIISNNSFKVINDVSINDVCNEYEKEGYHNVKRIRF